MLIAHGPLAVISSYYIQKDSLKKIKKINLTLLYIVAFLLGIFPDFDIFYLVSKGESSFNHHGLITHVPLFWIAVSFVLWAVLKTFIKGINEKLRSLIVITFAISTLSHIAADLFTGHIMLFYPFSNDYFTLFGNIVPDNMFGGYFANPIFAVEIIIIGLFVILLAKQFLNLNLQMILPVTITYFLFNCFIYTQNYQIDIYSKVQGNPVFDKDKDGLADAYDYDSDNNFVNNFDQVSKEELLTEVETIRGRTRLIPSNPASTSDKLLYLYGGHTTLRLIIQAYAQTGNYLSPVVHNYMKQTEVKRFSEGLYAYLLSTGKFLKPKENFIPIPGALVIVKYKKNYALGIVQRDGSVLIDDKNGVPTEYSLRSVPSNEIFIQQ
ncbi:metal-dependent hydrolase [bacterium]|nr:metal-dependent hydrolase [bacterium]